MAIPVSLPKQGQSVETCILTEWHKKPGDQVSEGDLLFSYETDKAAFEEEAKASGTLLEIFFKEGDEVPVLTNVAVIGNSGESTEEFRRSASKEMKEEEEQPLVETGPSQKEVFSRGEPVSRDGKIRISPRARKMAESLGVNPALISGSGPNGRIIVRDIESAGSRPATTQATAAEISSDDFTISPVSNIRRIIAENMQKSLSSSAQLTHHLTADARKILALRKEVKIRKEKEIIADVSLNDMVCYAVVQALKKHPEMNIHFLGDKIRKFNKVHLGMAVDTERGLMVPALKNADDYSLSGLSSQLKKLAADCRQNKIDPGLLASEAGSFTVSNLGVYGIEMFTPVLNIPQAGILGVNTISWKPSDLGDGTIGMIPVIGLSLTYDHRAIDGAPASAFLAGIKSIIENFNYTV